MNDDEVTILGYTECERCGAILCGWQSDEMRLTPGQAKTLHHSHCLGSHWRRWLIQRLRR